MASGFSSLLTPTREEVNLSNKNEVRAYFKSHQPKYVFLAAAKVGGIQANIDAPVEFLLENLNIQNNVIETSHEFNVRKLLFVGSSCIYPKESPCPIREEALMSGPLEPTNEGYALAKISGIRLCQFFRTQYKKDFITAIPTNLFGAGDHYDERNSHLLPALIHKIHLAKTLGKDSIPIWGSGRPRREFMLSDDCADALIFLMHHYSDSTPINVGTGEDHSVLGLAKIVSTVLDHNVTIHTDTEKPDGMMRKLIDSSRLKDMGWKNITPIHDGIQLAYNDYLQYH